VTLPPETATPRRSPVAFLLRLAATAAVLAILFRFLPVRQVGAALQLLPWSLLGVVLAGYLGMHVIASLKWRMMVNLAGAGLSVTQAVRCYFAGLFSVLVLPSIVGGDIVRAGLALRMGRSKAAVLFGSLLDRILDFLALAFLTISGAVLVPGSLSRASQHVFVILGAAAAIVLAAVILTIFFLPARRFSYGIRRKLVRLREAQDAMLARPEFVLASLALAILVQGGFIVLTAVLANGAGLQLSFHAWLFAWPMAKISALVPLTQGGIGVREATLAALLLPFGAPAAKTVAVGLAWEAVTVSGALVGGLASFLIGRLPSERYR
jgi:uncharacterized membrane protein YbhN (UPF0104 family)